MRRGGGKNGGEGRAKRNHGHGNVDLVTFGIRARRPDFNPQRKGRNHNKRVKLRTGKGRQKKDCENVQSKKNLR